MLLWIVAVFILFLTCRSVQVTMHESVDDRLEEALINANINKEASK